MQSQLDMLILKAVQCNKNIERLSMSHIAALQWRTLDLFIIVEKVVSINL